jgi:hypothetical protein
MLQQPFTSTACVLGEVQVHTMLRSFSEKTAEVVLINVAEIIQLSRWALGED